MFQKGQKALFLAPHTDDVEFACGGTLKKLINLGLEIKYIAFSTCEESVPKGFPGDVLVGEIKAATESLGLQNNALEILDYKVRTFPSRRQDILEKLVSIKKEFNPDYIFTPSVNDIHQDHKTIAEETLRAFKFQTIFAYEIPWNHLEFKYSSFIELSEEELKAKIDALSCYKSQAHRDYASGEFVRSLARTRGVQGGKPLAEAFDIVRLNL